MAGGAQLQELAEEYIWPPETVDEFARRQRLIRRVRADTEGPAKARAFYKHHPVEFICDFAITYDPRNVALGRSPTMPFTLFPIQVLLVEWLHERIKTERSGLIEKSRDMGATFTACAFAVWLWLFWPGASVGFGSRKEMLVDTKGDPDSIFEKIRMIIANLPDFLLPAGLSPRHLTYMKCINPETGSTITGEAGDNIGRGGRKLMYFKDEAQPLSARVLTPSGWTRMRELHVGGQVIGRDGKAQAITHINDCDGAQVYRFRFSDGSTVECSENHLWSVEKSWGKKKPLTLRAHEIAETFVYDSPLGQRQYRYRIPACAPVVFEAGKRPLSLDPYVVGVLLGAGTVHRAPTYRPTFLAADPRIADQVDMLLPEGCRCREMARDGQYEIGPPPGSSTVGRISVIGNAVVRSGIAGQAEDSKSIPHRYLTASKNKRLALLQGLSDAVSGWSSDVTQFRCRSVQLAEDVRFLVESLGGIATIKKPADRLAKAATFIVKITMPTSGKKPLYRTITGVTAIGVQPVRCITVANDDGLYLTDHCVATHNSAHYERPELIEAALADNTNVQIDMSSVCGAENVFFRKRHSGMVDLFIMDWRDHPAKTQEWHDRRFAEAEAAGLSHIFAQEVDRDYTAAVEGILIPRKYVDAAVDAHERLGLEIVGSERVGFDVADEGGDTNALVRTKGILVHHADQWAMGDPAQSTLRVFNYCIENGIDRMTYDSVGVGAGVKGKVRELLAMEQYQDVKLQVEPFSAGGKVWQPKKEFVEGKRNEDMFSNIKAQVWWWLFLRFQKTYLAVHHGNEYPADELISLSSKMPLLNELKTELSRPKRDEDGAGRIKVESKRDMKKRNVSSPNIAEALVMCYAPAQARRRQVRVMTVGPRT